jgi:hypothetical protein
MLASIPARMVNQNPTDLGIPIRFNLSSSRFSSPDEPRISRNSFFATLSNWSIAKVRRPFLANVFRTISLLIVK